MAKISCVTPEAGRKQYGYSETFINPIKKYIGDNPPLKIIKNVINLLGTDDHRMMDIMTTDGKKLIGKNQLPASEWVHTGKKIEPQVVVKVTNKEGTTHFISKHKTSVPPSRWIVNNGKIMPNNDWAQVEKNLLLDATGAPVPYTKQKGGFWKPSEDGQTGSFLNVQKIYNKQDKTNAELAELGYDARMTKNGIKLLHPSSQAIEPSRLPLVTDVRNFEPEVEKVKTVEPEEITEHLESLGIGKAVIGGVAGNIAGQVIDQDNEFGGSYIGTALGIALGVPSFRSKVKTGYKKLVDGNDELDVIIKSQNIQEKEIAELSKLQKAGYAGDLKDKEAIAEFKEKYYNSWEKLKLQGKSTFDLLFNNDVFESGFVFFKRIGVKSSQKLYDILTGVASADTVLFSKFSANLEAAYGKDFLPRSLDDLQVNIMNRVDLETKGMDNESVLEQFGSSLVRIITHETQLTGKGLSWSTANDAADIIYKDAKARFIDEAILKDPEAVKVIDVFKKTFDEYGENVKNIYRDEITRLVELIKDTPTAKMLSDVLNDGLDSKTFYKALTASDKVIFDRAIQNSTEFKEGVNYMNKLLRIEKLKGRYVPQIHSFVKEEKERLRFFRDNNLLNAPKREQQDAWEQEISRRILALNAKTSGELLELSDDGTGIITKSYKSVELAKDDLIFNKVSKITDPDLQARVAEDLNGINYRDYIGVRETNKGSIYYIKNPDKFKAEGINILEEFNKDTINSARQMYMSLLTTKQSNYLDNPRNYILPTELLETNLNRLNEIYTKDVGTRLHLIKNELGSDFHLGKSLSKIREELVDKVDGNFPVDREMDRIKSWYRNLNGQAESFRVNKDSVSLVEDFKRQRRNEKLLETIKNLGLMPFLYFTSFVYPIFQNFIVTPFFARWGNIASAHAYYAKNPDALRASVNEMKKFGVLKDKLSSFSPEMQDIKSDMLRGGEGDLVDILHGYSKRGLDFASRFSLTKTILPNLDLEKTGLLRLGLGNIFEVTGAESAVTTMAVLRQVDEYVAALEKMRVEKTGNVTVDGTRYTRGDIERQMKGLGIHDVDRFLDGAKTVNESYGKASLDSFIAKFQGADVDLADMPDYFREDMIRVVDGVINNYHGRARESRPLLWSNNPYGRVLSQFATYPQNFYTRTIRERLYQPIADWNSMYKSQKADNASVFKLYHYAKSGNDAKFKELFGNDMWEEAYNNFPIMAYNNAFKVLPAILGVGKVMLMTRGALQDTIGMTLNTAIGDDDFESWKRTRKNFSLNGHRDDDERIWINDLVDGDETGMDIVKLMSGALHHVTEMGTFGRIPQMFINEARYSQGAFFEKFTATDKISEFLTAITTPTRVPYEDMLEATSRELLEFTLQHGLPIVGSFSEITRGVPNAVYNKPKNRNKKLYDSESGNELNDLDFFLEF